MQFHSPIDALRFCFSCGSELREAEKFVNPLPPSSKSTFSQPFKEKHIGEVERIVWSSLIWVSYVNQVLHTVWCNISDEAAGEIWNWSLLEAKPVTPSFGGGGGRGGGWGIGEWYPSIYPYASVHIQDIVFRYPKSAAYLGQFAFKIHDFSHLLFRVALCTQEFGDLCHVVHIRLDHLLSSYGMRSRISRQGPEPCTLQSITGIHHLRMLEVDFSLQAEPRLFNLRYRK